MKRWPPGPGAVNLRWLIGALVLLLLPLVGLLLGMGDYVPILLIPAIMIGSALLAAAFGTAGPDRDEDRDGPEGEDGGEGRRRPGPRPDAPWGGVPLPDASPPRFRLRDHGGPERRRLVRRDHRPAVAPARPARRERITSH